MTTTKDPAGASPASAPTDAPATSPETVEAPASDAPTTIPGAPSRPPSAPGKQPRDVLRTIREMRLARVGKKKAPPKIQENPLREGLRLEKMPDPFVFVLFGATGDLAHRKVFPALYQLWRTNLLPHEYMLMAIGRRDYTDESFRAEIRASLEKYSRVLPIDEQVWAEFAKRLVYDKADFNDDAAYARLSERLDECDEDHGTRGNRLYYLATPPSAFTEIIAQLGRVGLDHETHGGGWRRVVIEKPFGRDSDSAVRLNREVGKVFREKQVYRIDHYLGKETVRNLLVFRFGNGIFEPVWNRRYVDHVQITVAESIGIEGRGAFYEETGASRDFLQNHLMQLLSLVAMEPPASFQADALRDEKVTVLRAISPMSQDEIRRNIVRGQYGRGWVAAEEVPAYHEEHDVDPKSETETFVAARFEIDDWRWAGVPFYLRMGKRLPKRASEIAIQFRQVPHRLFTDAGTDPEANLLAMRIQPDEGILLRFGAKVPGLGLDVRAVNMDFMYGSAFSVDSPDAYETLILDALLGDASLFTRADEVEEAWGIVTPILEAWIDGAPTEFPNYPAGTWGPEEADSLLGMDGRRWRRI